MQRPTTAKLFVTCLLDTLFPDVARGIVEVLEAQGVRVSVPRGQTCCGQPAFNGGYWQEARVMARHTIDALGDSDEPVVIASGSCASMVVHYYPELFNGDPRYGPRARALAGRVVEFTQFVVDHLGVTDVGARFERRVIYHPSCHALRGMGIDGQPRALLGAVRGLEVVAQRDPATCCGFGGVFAVKMGEISGAMLAGRLDAFEDAGADLVVGCDVSCLMHIEGGLRKRGSAVRTMHIAQLLAEGIRRG
jgi:L-lactate dehydrogenase complex protein LldE